MRTKIFTFLLLLSIVFPKVQAQFNVDFNNSTDLTYWSGGNGTLSLADDKYLAATCTGGYWVTASFALYKNWDFDNNKVVVVKVKERKGSLAFKIQVDGSSERILSDPSPTTIPSTTNVIHMFAFGDNSSYSELQSGTSKVNTIQVATEGISTNDIVYIDWIKTFATKADANAYIAEQSKMDNDFNSSDNLINWSSSTATLSQSDGHMVATANTGYGYAIAAYEPATYGLKWNLDLQKAFVVKTSNTGNFAIKFRSNTLNKDYLYTCATPAAIPNSNDELHVFAFEDQAATYPELTGVVKFDNMQLAYEGVSNGTVINVDYIKTFASKTEANNFVNTQLIITGNSLHQDNTFNLVPFKGGIIISNTDNPVPFNVYNIAGALVKSGTVTDRTVVSLIKGLYIIQINGKSKKVIIY